MCDATVLPHCVHLLSCGGCQRWDALRVRRRIFEVLRFGTPIRAAHESRKWEKDNGGRFWMLGICEEASAKSCLKAKAYLNFNLSSSSQAGGASLMTLSGLAAIVPAALQTRSPSRSQCG